MSYTYSRLMSAATAAYGVYALAKPRHLGALLSDNPEEQSHYDVLARAYGVRDLTISALGLFGRGPLVPAAIALRVMGDLSDAAVLSPKTRDSSARTKLLTATLGWATLNALALAADRRSAQVATSAAPRLAEPCTCTGCAVDAAFGQHNPCTCTGWWLSRLDMFEHMFDSE